MHEAPGSVVAPAAAAICAGVKGMPRVQYLGS